jgi:hypothetical protein
MHCTMMGLYQLNSYAQRRCWHNGGANVSDHYESTTGMAANDWHIQIVEQR